jgi:pyridoxamine 5'-phosphate oxidase
MENWISANDKPIDIFTTWFQEAQESDNFEPTAMTLATVDSTGMPSARIVLLKEFNEEGFCFFTNYESVKGQELLTHPKAALVFHWEKPFHRQIRIRGLIEKLNYERSNAYFQRRVRGSQIGAWASPQSRKISSREELVDLVKKTEKRFEGQEEIPCPENWGGFCLKPLSIEFWQEQQFRLHDRLHFTRNDLSQAWSAQRLAP